MDQRDACHYPVFDPLSMTPAGGSWHTTRMVLRVPQNFSFWRTAYSHGWCSLLPFSYSPDTEELERTLALSSGKVVHCRMKSLAAGVRLTVLSAEPLQEVERLEIKRQIRDCLRLEEDFSEFHIAARRHVPYRWIARAGAGRLLRAPTVYEDLVKTLCTTNCTWRLTTIMVTNLVRRAGRQFDEGRFAFPSAADVAALSERELRTEIKSGYRSPFLHEVSARVASGELDVEGWRTSPLATEDLYKEIVKVKGLGPYAAGNLLRLLGRADYLALDSWVRAQYSVLHANGRKVKDSVIERHYKDYGRWRGLFFWLEMTRDWHDGKFRL